MKYKIIVDKQSRVNPSNEKRTYEIDIEELRRKGNIADSFIVTREEAYVMRRLSLSEYHVLSTLPEPVKEPLENISIELFEGENYIYLIDMTGNRFYAEYTLNNDFNKTFATKVEMFATIETLADMINLELQKKVDGEDYTAAQILLLINEDESEAKIKADKISLIGKILNFTADAMSLTSDNFSIDEDGNIEAKSGKIGGFNLGEEEFSTNINGKYNFNEYDARNVIAMQKGIISKPFTVSDIYDINEDGNINLIDAQKIIRIISGLEENTKLVNGTFKINSKDAKNFLSIMNEGILAVSLGTGGINTHLLSAENIVCSTSSDDIAIALNGETGEISGKNFNNTSLEETKKNIKKFRTSMLETIKNAEIYEYNYKTEDDMHKRHIGFVIGEKYKTPFEAISDNGQAIDIYAMCSILWKAVQELTEKVERREGKLNEKD